MRRRNELEQLHQIAAIREVQRIAAEGKAVRAASAVREREAAKAESERIRAQAEEGWRTVVSAPSLQLEMTHLWSAELCRREQGVMRAGAHVEAAAAESARRIKAWHTATMIRDKAQGMFESAAKDQAKRREENVLQEASDRFGLVAWRP